MLQEALDVALRHPFISGPVLVVVLFLLSYYALRPRNLPPGPLGIPWIGSPHLLSDNIHHDLNNLAKKYGEIFTIMMGLRPLIVLNSNRLAREAFIKRADVFSNRPVMYCLDYMDLYDELFNTRYSEKWKERKKIMVRILRAAGFGSQGMESRFHVALKQYFESVDRFQQKPFNPKADLQRLLATITANVVFDAKYNFNDPGVAQLVTFGADWIDSVYKYGAAKGYWADNVPFSITKLLFPTMMNEMKRSTEVIQKFILERVAEHREVLDKDNPRDVIDGYLVHRGDDPELTGLALSSTLLMLFPDAIDSTAGYLSYLILYLACYPDWQRKIQEQIDEVCGSRSPGLNDKPSLPLVEAHIMEVGRIVSVVCLSIAHSPMKDTVFEGYNIPEDCYILSNIWAANNEPDIFPQGENFAPETLIDENGKLVRNEKILSFGVGRRMCIGEQMVKYECFLFTSNLLHRYDVKLPQGRPRPSLESVGGLIRAPQPYDVCLVPRAGKETME